jgi:nucleotide-binding universal stress UspA family protein
VRALVWIVEDTWEATVAEAGALLPGETEVTLLHVAPAGVEALAHPPRLGRRHPPPPIRPIADEAARALLEEAAARLARPARTLALRGHVEHVVVEAAREADLLVLARDGGHAHPGPHSIGHAARFVVDHAPCRVLLVWPG